MTPLPGVHALSMMTRYVIGGRQRILEILSLAVQAADPLAGRWSAVFTDLSPAQQKRISFDDVCAASGVSPADLMGVIVRVGMQAGEDMTSIVESSLRPAVVAQMGKSAMRIESTKRRPLSDKELEIAQRDRLKFLENSGFVAIPRNATISVHATANAAAASAARAEPSVPSFARDMQSLEGPKDTIQQQLIDTPVPDRVVDGEAVEAE